MRNLTLLALLCLVATVSHAQYKKASFLTRRGINMELTGRASFISKSNLVQPAVAYSIGREKDDSRYFSWHDFEILLPAKYSYSTTVNTYNGHDEAITVETKTKFGFQYRFNSGIFILDNSNEENKLLPFVNFGASFLFHAGSQESDFYYQYNGDLAEYPSEPTMYAGLNAGAGLIYKINRKIGLKATAGYSLMGNLADIDNVGSYSEYYSFYKSHPYVTLGFRFVIPRGGE